MKNNIFDFFQTTNKKYTIHEIASACSVNIGTIKRWKEKGELISEIKKGAFLD